MKIKMQFSIFFIFFLFFLVEIYANKYGDYLYEINHWHGSLYKKKNVIYLIGNGGAVPEKVEEFMLHYDVFCSLNLEKARQLIVHMAEDLIKRVNSDPKGHLYMSNYPITCQNVNIMVGFSKSDCSYPDSPNIGYAFTVNGRIFYMVYDPVQKRLVECYKENYDEAKRLVLEGECEH